MCVMRNHERLVALYYAALLAGAAPLLLDPHCTQRELAHFLPLVRPRLVLCDADRRDVVRAALVLGGDLTDRDLITDDQLDQFTAGHHGDLEHFQPAAVAEDARAVMLPTSGSTGLAKAAEITHSALVRQLPSLWSHDARFPRPTERALVTSTAQWMTFTNMLTTCPVYEVTLVLTPDRSLPTVLRIMETYKPTWMLLSPASAADVAAAAPPALRCLRRALLTGAAPPPAALRGLQRAAPSAQVLNSYGMTEAQGFVAHADSDTPLGSIGKIYNIFKYKLVDEDEKEVALGEKGELYLWSDCIIKRYVNNEEAYKESVAAGGWWRTGDLFTEDGRGNLHFVARKKFWFKHLNYQISPEELEQVIGSVPGVREAAVAGCARGAAAAVVAADGRRLRRADVHRAVNEAVSEYKRLHGGIAFVTSLPRTHTGKLDRAACAALLQQLVDSGQCC
ncbi:luciferin 4-monooxygenase-like isoform X2 [Pectinophora gossypiella]|nr:luciferin 4-monooxygenase-like isoform X2 [Pectinophora gossypiella]XP_049878918.1 luciferin 4-monooxygenase-like isoform X2 [Pectinophora gossypiella]